MTVGVFCRPRNGPFERQRASQRVSSAEGLHLFEPASASGAKTATDKNIPTVSKPGFVQTKNLRIAQDRDRTMPDSTEKSSDSVKGAAKSAAIDPALAELVANWPSLPAIIKSAILAVARLHLANG
jgi:hypothetical protein